MSRKLFGTDGIRGVAGEFPLDGSTVFAIGRALGHHLSRGKRRPRVVIGQDTRESSAWIANAVAAGLVSWTAEVSSAGVITTPGIAYLARELNFDAGVVISASHNPWTDNGIKIFGHDGYKLSDELEEKIEADIFFHLHNRHEAQRGDDVHGADDSSEQQPASGTDPALLREYVEWLGAS